jgi:8-oxo-dGTP diphosphatase
MNNKYHVVQTQFLTKVLIKYENTFLMLKDIDGDQTNPRAGWETVGGHLEYGEDLEQALNREIKEETGLSNVKILFPFHTFLFYPDTDKSLGGIIYLAEAENKNVILDMKEHSEAKWCTLEDIEQMTESRGTQMEFAAYKSFLNALKEKQEFIDFA